MRSISTTTRSRPARSQTSSFSARDLRSLGDPGAPFDGIWSSFANAYFTDFAPVLASWAAYVRPGGWIALTEIDDLFGHAPLSERTTALLHAYADEALAAKRYDFHTGRKLAGFATQAGLVVERTFDVEDAELAFDGPASDAVVESWAARLDRMTLLRTFCGSAWAEVRDEFLACLRSPEHRATARVVFCFARTALHSSR